MAYQCVNASNQYFTIAAPNISVPPVTFSLWINVSSVVAKDTALFIWRGSINTGLFLKYVNPNWELRYCVAGGTQWQTATGLYLSTGVWQHACVAISSSQARLYLNGTSFTNNVSHSTANINAAGDLARDPLADSSHTSFNGSVAEAAIWTASLTDAECLALSKRVSPLRLTNRLAEPGDVQGHDSRSESGHRADADRGQRANRRRASAHDLSIEPAAGHVHAGTLSRPVPHVDGHGAWQSGDAGNR